MNNNTSRQNISSDGCLVQPWYRIGMVWMMIALPTIVVIASIVTAVIAYKNAPLLNPVQIGVVNDERSAELETSP